MCSKCMSLLCQPAYGLESWTGNPCTLHKPTPDRTEAAPDIATVLRGSINILPLFHSRCLLSLAGLQQLHDNFFFLKKRGGGHLHGLLMARVTMVGSERSWIRLSVELRAHAQQSIPPSETLLRSIGSRPAIAAINK